MGEIAATLRRLLSSSPDPDDVSSEVIRTLASSAASLCCTCRCEGGGCCDDASCTCSASPSASSPSCCRSAAASNEGSNEVSSSDGEGIDEPHHRECAAPLGASCLQQGMLYLHAAAPQQRTFVESVTWALDGPLDASRFRRAWEAVVAATPMLRTRFEPSATPQPLQVVDRQHEGVRGRGEAEEAEAEERCSLEVDARRALATDRRVDGGGACGGALAAAVVVDSERERRRRLHNLQRLRRRIRREAGAQHRRRSDHRLPRAAEAGSVERAVECPRDRFNKGTLLRRGGVEVQHALLQAAGAERRGALSVVRFVDPLAIR